MSPINSNKKGRSEYEGGIRPIKVIKVSQKDIPTSGIDNSSFDGLHELCNIQIEELKKSLKFVSDERDRSS